MDSQLDHIEETLQVVLDAICALAKEMTGKSMVIGQIGGNGYVSVGATPLSESIIWLPADPLTASSTG